MKSTDAQTLFGTIIAADAGTDYIRTIPTAQAKSGDGSASIDLGYPPETFTSPTAGGKYTDGRDHNGFLNMLSGAVQGTQARGWSVWDSDFATGIGGYPQYAIVLYGGAYYISTADDNTTTPGASGSSWVSWLYNAALTGTPTTPTPTDVPGVNTGNHIPDTYWVDEWYAPKASARLITDPSQAVVFGTPGTYTWTVPAGVYSIRVRLWGAGGGSGALSTPNGASRSGGPGAYAEKLMLVTPGTTYTITVGAGGATGLYNASVAISAGTNPSSGGNGGTTSFDTIFAATGGEGGGYSTAGIGLAGGAAGVATGAYDLGMSGTGGAWGSQTKGGDYVMGPSSGAPMGGQATQIHFNDTSYGGNWPGGGACGCCGVASGGALGAGGLCIVELNV